MNNVYTVIKPLKNMTCAIFFVLKDMLCY